MSIEFHRDGPWELPEGWVWARLGDLCDFVGRGRGPTYVEEGGVAVVNQKCVRWRKFEDRFVRQTARSAFENLLPHLHLQNGDVLWNSTGTGTIGRAVVYDGHLSEATVDSHITIVRPRWINSDFVCSYIETMRIQHLVTDEHVGSTNQQELPRAFVQELLIPVPPATEQRRIVARIDELFTEIADGETALARAHIDLDTWRRSLLKAAVTGELTREWRDHNMPNESGTNFVNRIDSERGATSRKIAKRIADRSSDLDLANLPVLPDSWTWAALPDICVADERNGISIKGASDPPGTKALRLDALTPTALDLSACRYIPLLQERVAVYRVNVHDFLVSRANGSEEFVGRAVYVPSVDEEFVFPDTIIRYPLFPSETLGHWVQLAWSSPFTRRQIIEKAKTSAGILKISQDDIAQIAIPIPPESEMAVIIDTVQSNFEFAEARRYLDDSSQDAARLRQSILKTGFEGKLVEQDPRDEPADRLLARLSDQAEVTVLARRTRGRTARTAVSAN